MATYYMCINRLHLTKQELFNDHIKNVVKLWYEADPKSEVGEFYDDDITIIKIIEHSINSYNNLQHINI